MNPSKIQSAKRLDQQKTTGVFPFPFLFKSLEMEDSDFETLEDCCLYLQTSPIVSWKKKEVTHQGVYGLLKLNVNNVKNSSHSAAAVLNDKDFKWCSDFDHCDYYFCDNNAIHWYVVSWKEEGDHAYFTYIGHIPNAPTFVVKWNEREGGDLVGPLSIKNTHHWFAAWKLSA